MKKINIKGQDYVPVHERLMEFWKNNSSWSIRTEILESPQGMIRFKACIYDEHGTLRACGHAQEQQDSSFINKTSYVENCETSAIGRCLAALGIGIDTSMASFEEVANAMAQQDDQREKPKQFYDDDRDWLTQTQFEKTIERFNSGEIDVIDKVIKTFRMRRDLQEQLLKMKGGNGNG
ncbi:MAG TPA: hypothetical protein PLW31_02580 [Bacteroidales bacterium]|nr:hypothetical protein [Bacteroidales bacterium]HPM02203.1 hypothetical protein [Candidatus Cloacimonadota bacterium]